MLGKMSTAFLQCKCEVSATPLSGVGAFVAPDSGGHLKSLATSGYSLSTLRVGSLRRVKS